MRILRSKGWVATVLVTAVTLVLVSGVVLITTNVGCGAENQIGVKLARCPALTPTASRNTPPPIIIRSPSPIQNAPIAAPGTSYPPQNNPGTSYPPQNNPGTYYPNLPAGSSGRAPQQPFYGTATGSSSAAGAPGFPTLSCTLPVFAGPPGSGGFVTFPGGGFTADPRSSVALPSPGVTPGYGVGYSGMTYDRAHSRWLPVGLQFVAPDFSHYAYTSNGELYVVNASNSSEVELGQGQRWNILKVLNDRVYATVLNVGGFWVLPFSGTPVEVTAQGFWQAATAEAAYGTATSAVPNGANQQLLKLDIATGKTSSWFSLPDASGVSVQGFDGTGNPIVLVNYNFPNNSYYNSWELWVTTSATDGYVLANSQEGWNFNGPYVSDSHGLWFSVNAQYPLTGLALYVPGSAIYVMSAYGAQLAGPCA